jgi:colanic acid/amylovoran biosynthesis protein WcaK/AmsJ
MAQEMNENILLINIHSSRNSGDGALLQVTLQQLVNNFPDCRLTLCMDDPESHLGKEQTIYSIFSWVHPFTSDGKSRWNFFRLAWLLPASLFPIVGRRIIKRPVWLLTPPSLRKIVSAYTEADLVVSKPGGFLYSSGRGVNLLIALYSVILALFAGKLVYIFPQSIGPLNHQWERHILRWMLNHVRIVMVREPISMQLIQKCGVNNPRCYVIPDVAFAMPSLGREAGEVWLQQNGIDPKGGYPLLGMTVFNWGAMNPRFGMQSAYEVACASAIRYFVEFYRGRVILFPQVWGPLISQDDRITARRIFSLLPDLADFVNMVEEPLPAELLKSVYGWMDVFIGTRMHSNIFALSEGVPVIAIGYQQKTEGIARMVGVEKWVIDIQQVQGNELVEKLKELWMERQAWRVSIRQAIPNLIKEANRAGKIVADDFFELQKVNQVE